MSSTIAKYMIKLVNLLILLTTLSYSIAAQSVSTQEALDFAKSVEESVTNEEPKFLNNIFAAQEFGARVTQEILYDKEDSIGSYIPTALNNMKFGDRIISHVANGSYQLVKQYDNNGIQHLIFRLFDGESLNYHDYELIKKDGDVKVVDIYLYISGENMSKTVANIMDNLLNSKTSTIKNLKEVKLRMNYGDYDRALTTFKKLDKNIKSTKAAQIIYLQILMSLDDDKKYVNALAQYQKDFPNDPSLHLIMIDYYFLKEEYKQTLIEINNLDTLINSDPFLDYYRSLIYNAMNDTTQAIKHLEQLYKNMPDFRNGALELIANYLLNKQYKEAQPVIATYRKNYGDADLKTLAITYPEYEEYLLFAE